MSAILLASRINMSHFAELAAINVGAKKTENGRSRIHDIAYVGSNPRGAITSFFFNANF